MFWSFSVLSYAFGFWTTMSILWSSHVFWSRSNLCFVNPFWSTQLVWVTHCNPKICSSSSSTDFPFFLLLICKLFYNHTFNLLYSHTVNLLICSLLLLHHLILMLCFNFQNSYKVCQWSIYLVRLWSTFCSTFGIWFVALFPKHSTLGMRISKKPWKFSFTILARNDIPKHLNLMNSLLHNERTRIQPWYVWDFAPFLEGTQSVVIWRGVARFAPLGVNINFPFLGGGAGGFKDTIVLGLLQQGINVLKFLLLNNLNPKIIQ